MAGESVKVILVAFLMNLGIAIAKFVGFFFTGSSAMLAEGLHSVADTTNQIFLFLGVQKSRKPATEEHPFGYGKEQYIWSFLVALMIFAMGSVYSLYEGIHKLMHPTEITNVWWNIVILGLGIVLEGYSSFVATREFNKVRGRRKFWKYVRSSKDAVLVTILFEDYAALLGLAIALIGTIGYQITGNPYFDSGATIGIGVLLGVIAFFLYLEARSLLLGESASQEDREAIKQVFLDHDSVVKLKELLTLHFGKDQLLVTAHVKFQEHMKLAEIENAIDDMEEKIVSAVPSVYKIFIETHQKDFVVPIKGPDGKKKVPTYDPPPETESEEKATDQEENDQSAPSEH